MPEECPSIRSMARWVLPVLVGPSTAVTPAPRRRPSRVTGDENEIDISFPGWGGLLQRADRPLCITMRRRTAAHLTVGNESGTNPARIGDSGAVQLRSPRYLAEPSPGATISGSAARQLSCKTPSKR